MTTHEPGRGEDATQRPTPHEETYGAQDRGRPSLPQDGDQQSVDQEQYRDMPYGAQTYGSPQYGSPQYGSPQYGSPQYGAHGGGAFPPQYGPVSDKTRIAAGLLQFFLGGWGAGRFYLGWTRIALWQLGLWLSGVVLMVGGAIAATMVDPSSPAGIIVLLPFVGWLVIMAEGLWALVDAIRMLIGKVPDAEGRALQ